MLTHFLSLLALPVLCVLWVIFQSWLAKQDPDYQGYKAGCGGCTRSCGEHEPENCESVTVDKDKSIHYVDASSLLSKTK